MCVRVLSLRSSVIHGFVTEPWYSHHVRVFMWERGFECARVARSLVCVPCFMLERGVWIPALMSWVSVTWQGSDTRAPFSVIVWVRGLEFASNSCFPSLPSSFAPFIISLCLQFRVGSLPYVRCRLCPALPCPALSSPALPASQPVCFSPTG